MDRETEGRRNKENKSQRDREPERERETENRKRESEREATLTDFAGVVSTFTLVLLLDALVLFKYDARSAVKSLALYRLS